MAEGLQTLRIRDHMFKRIPIQEDGNCFFRAIALWTYGDQDYHYDVRHLVVHHIVYHWPRYKYFIIGDESYDERIKSAKDYFNLMKVNGKYGGAQECVAVSELYLTKLLIFNLDSLTSPPQVYGHEHNNIYTLLFSGERDSGHFDVIVQNDHTVINMGF